MKKILFILILMTTYSCSSIRFDDSYLNYSGSEIDKKFNESQINNCMANSMYTRMQGHAHNPSNPVLALDNNLSTSSADDAWNLQHTSARTVAA